MKNYCPAALRLTLTLGLSLLLPGLTFAQVKPDDAPHLLSSPRTAQAANLTIQRDEVLTLDSELVSINVTVTDRQGRPLTGLGKSAFSVIDNKVSQEIAFFSDADAPASIGIVFDHSASMTEEKLSRAREAVSRVLENSHEQDEFFLVGFSSNVRLLVDHTKDAETLVQSLAGVQPKGYTSLYDACYLAVEKASRGRHARKAIILISDGEDNNSRYSYKELRHLLAESNVTIYAIGISQDVSMPSLLTQQVFDGLASVSGGKAYYPEDTSEMNEAFDRIAVDLRHQYSIAYRPSNFSRNGSWHRLKISVRLPSDTPRPVVRSREGYFAISR